MTRRISLDIADVKQLPMVHRTTIPEEYLDDMGHMNVMWYTHLFSVAMGGMFQSVGLHWENLEKHHGGTFALESHIRYLSEVRVGQTVEIHSRMIGRSEKRFHAILFMTNQDKADVSAVFEFVGAYVDLLARRMASIPSHAAEKIDQLASQDNALPWEAPICGVMEP
jgi:acyl-CoA thioester hydrolase